MSEVYGLQSSIHQEAAEAHAQQIGATRIINFQGPASFFYAAIPDGFDAEAWAQMHGCRRFLQEYRKSEGRWYCAVTFYGAGVGQ